MKLTKKNVRLMSIQCVGRFRFLAKYQDAWPVEEFIRSRLKYQREKLIKGDQKAIVDGVKKENRRQELRRSKRRKTA